jgi:hypothetical protein
MAERPLHRHADRDISVLPSVRVCLVATAAAAAAAAAAGLTVVKDHGSLEIFGAEGRELVDGLVPGDEVALRHGPPGACRPGPSRENRGWSGLGGVEWGVSAVGGGDGGRVGTAQAVRSGAGRVEGAGFYLVGRGMEGEERPK